MSRSLSAKKSAPRMGLATSARKNLCFVLRPVKDKLRETVPKVGMEDPLAALKEEVPGERCP